MNGSIWPIGDNQWALGGLMLCDRLIEGADVPNDAITVWKDSDGVKYCLRPQITRQRVPEYDPANGPIIPRHFSSAIFEIGRDVLIKVKYAPVGWSRHEGRSIKLVQERAPSVPIPEIIHFWMDEELKRYFLIMRRVQGELINDVYFTLSRDQVINMMDELGRHVKAVSDITAPCFQNVDGKPVVDSFMLKYEIKTATGVWEVILDEFPGPFTVDEFRGEMCRCGGVEPPEMDSEFHFVHRDMGPTNVIIQKANELLENGDNKWRVAGIIDWEMAGFYPKFFITCHLIAGNGHYVIDAPDHIDNKPMWRGHYASLLDRSLRIAGLQGGHNFQSWYSIHKRAILGTPPDDDEKSRMFPG